MHRSSAHARNLVGRHADAYARSADGNAQVGLGAGHCPTHRRSVVGIVDRLIGVGSEVEYLETPVAQMSGNRVLQAETRVVRADCDGDAVHPHTLRQRHDVGNPPAAWISQPAPSQVAGHELGASVTFRAVSFDPATPVIVGAGQFINRVDEGADPLAPTDLVLEAIGRAEADSGASTALAKLAQVVAVVRMISWRYSDPGRIIADRLGATDSRTWYPPMGGNTPQMMLNRICSQITEGQLDVALLCGGEAWNTRTNAKRAGTRPEWDEQDPSLVPDWGSEETFTLGHPAEHARGIAAPVQSYPLFETAIMHETLTKHPERGVRDQIDLVGEMWSGFSSVAAENPYAWNRTELSGSEITTATASNRYVGWPYTKRMVSNPDVDMASALVVTSAGAAESAGVPRDRWIFPWSGTDGTDLVMSERESFVRSPSVGIAGRRALELAGLTLDQVEHLDVYSCFPSAVQLFCKEFGIDPLSRPLTVYGGLAFGGGPWNNPVGHALATMVDRLRESGDAFGLVTANGGNVDKHAFGVLGSTPPPAGFRYERPQTEIDSAATRRSVLEEYRGPATVETWTVMHDRSNEPERYLGSCLTPEGDRTWVASSDADLMATAMTTDIGGRAAHLDTEGAIHLID